MYYHDHADVLAQAPPRETREQLATRLLREIEEDEQREDKRLQLIAYLRILNAYRAMRAALVIREQLPTSDVARVSYLRALDAYTHSLSRLPGWCVPPSYVAEGM